jgi:hypothetical protein
VCRRCRDVLILVALATSCARPPLKPESAADTRPDARNDVAGFGGREGASRGDASIIEVAPTGATGGADRAYARDDAIDASVEARLEAADGADLGGTSPDAVAKKPRVLSRVVNGAPWYATQSTQGMAVDEMDRVFVSDSANVYVVDGSSVSTYLTIGDVVDPPTSESGFGDMDIGPDGQLYLIVATGPFAPVRVVRSAIAHQEQPWVDISMVGQAQELSVISDGRVAIVSNTGFWTFTATDAQHVYDISLLGPADNCATKDLAAAPSGVFLYQSGCNGYPLLRGNADGSGVSVLYQAGSAPPIPASNFLCLARDPLGGFAVVADDPTDYAPRLYHVAENTEGVMGATLIETTPSFVEAKRSQDEAFGFDFCSVATARDGTVFIQTYSQLWKISP